MLKRTPLSMSLLMAFGGLAALSGPAAMAQPQQQQLEKVEITGSNIRRVQSETATPVTTLNRADIERSGRTSVADLLQSLAVDNQGSVPRSFGNGFASGAA